MVQPSDRSGEPSGADDLGTWIGEGEPPVDFVRASQAASASVEAPSPVNRDRRLLLGLSGLILAWLAVVGLGRLAAPDEIAQPPAPTATPQSTATPAPTATPMPTPTPELEVPAENVDVAQLGARMESSVQVERMVRQLGRRGSEAILAYRSAQGIVLVDLAAGTADIVEPSTQALEYAPQYVVVRTGGDTHTIDLDPTDVLLRAAGQTIAIDPHDLDVRLIAEDASLIVTDTESSAMFWVPGRDLQGQAAEVISLDGGRVEWFRAPHAVQLVVEDGLGLLAVSKAGGGETLLASGGEFVELFGDPVVDANASGALLEVCDGAACRFDVVGASEWTVPADFVEQGDRFLLSPDSAALLRYTEHGFAEIYRQPDDSVSWVTGASMHHAAWGPDSSFVAWIDLLGAPEIRVMFIDERDWLRVDLDDMGLPRPIGTELVVFEQPSDEPASS